MRKRSMGLPEGRDIGKAVLSLSGPVEAGSYQSFILKYTAGIYGIDDSGSLKICFRFASDMGTPQFDDPDGPDYVRAAASNGAGLELRYDKKQNVRPWGKTLYIKVVNGFLAQGDIIRVSFGGNPGYRMQTFCEDSFEFKVLVDPIATYVYSEIKDSPTVSIVPGPASVWKAVVPSDRQAGEVFSLRVKAEDRWGNPTDVKPTTLKLCPTIPVTNLPDEIESAAPFSLENLSCERAGTCVIEVTAPERQTVRSNPLRVLKNAAYRRFWGDMHGQSEETIGSNTVEDYFAFARDKAWLDFASHQGNDFQITREFWNRLQDTTLRVTKDGEFVAFPGYEWSGNTSLGGDHNVYFRREGEQIHRSSHALVDDHSDIETDCPTTSSLFTALEDSDAMVVAHVGGRYADLHSARSGLLRAVEIHSAWGTFEWLLHDAFRQGLKVGVVCNSDGHKGRPGASYPGASQFGSYGGLTCVFSEELSRKAIWNAFLERRHYGTTGARIYLDVFAKIDKESLPMGAATNTRNDTVTLDIDVSPAAPLVRVEVYNGEKGVATLRPESFGSKTGNRILVTWSGAAFRGRGRQSDWTGSLRLEDGEITDVTTFNFHNPLQQLRQASDFELEWESNTTGGICGCIVTLKDGMSGIMRFRTSQVIFYLSLDRLGHEAIEYNAGGLDRKVRVERLPSSNPCSDVSFAVPVKLEKDNQIYVKVVQEDGHMAWSSPIYISSETSH